MTEVLRLTAFSNDPAGGNPAGVVLDTGDLDDTQMQLIAAEVGYSETAFVTPHPTGRGHYRLRFFSPLAEVNFCGHATIATSIAVAERDGAGPLTFETAAGSIEVHTRRTDEGFTAALRSVPTHSHRAAAQDVAAALQALRWPAEDLDPHLPSHVSYAGNYHLVLPVRSRERLAQLDYDFEALKGLMLHRDWTTLQLFWREDQSTIHARNPFPVGGVVEDPATGAAAAALGGYLRTVGHITARTRITILQGEDMGRPSTLTITVDPTDPRVTVSGTAARLDAETQSTAGRPAW